jgi:hypothetical protein
MALLDAGDNFLALRKVADALVTKAMEGDVPAIRELADRTDGKVPQAVQADVKGTVSVGLIRFGDLDK